MCCSPQAFPFLLVNGVIGYLSFKSNVEINTLISSLFPLLSLLYCCQPIYSLDMISVTPQQNYFVPYSLNVNIVSQNK